VAAVVADGGLANSEVEGKKPESVERVSDAMRRQIPAETEEALMPYSERLG
jgi:hypothetical protein